MGQRSFKDRNVAALLAFFLGTFGIHRFYLGQTGLGIVYCLFMFTSIPTILGFIDALAFLSADEERFNRKYNRRYFEDNKGKFQSEQPFERQNRNRDREEQNWNRGKSSQTQPYRTTNSSDKERVQRTQQHKENMQRAAGFREEGIKLFKAYDYEAAIHSFEQVITIDEKDVATHFNLACAYSLEENAQKSLYHLDKAVDYGFTDFQKIKTHDALAFLRIQSDFDAFEQNKFRLSPKEKERETQKATSNENYKDLLETDTEPDLLDQLQRLSELRNRGLLSQEDFVKEKKRLLS